MSLVELMVGMLIGLIGIIIITHLYVTNDQYKRSTTGSGTAHVNGAVALYTLERELRMAGYGVNHSLALGCSCVGVNCSPIQYYYNANSSFPPAPSAVGALPPRAAVPVIISETPGLPDTITVLYSGANERMLPAMISEPTVSPNHHYKVDSAQGFADNNLVLVIEGGTCVLKQLSKAQSATGMEHLTGPFNPGGSFGPAFNANAGVFNLGTPGAIGGPVWRTFFVAQNRLQAEDVLRSLAAGVVVSEQLVEDIVDLQAQYGKDNVGNDNVVDTWDTVPPADGTEWGRVLAVRVGLLARSPNFEKPSVDGGPCEATQAAPAWAGGAFTVPGGVPSCFKHRVFETVIPLRNMIWRPA
jgi:type IV pilus assembly protein PilW